MVSGFASILERESNLWGLAQAKLSLAEAGITKFLLGFGLMNF
ncbi:hypothetical protein NUH30_05575 [Leptospira sp. 85282-16]|nr:MULTISPECIES: hypothetical protein [Leptospira]MCT8333134.1 hypothetical protein [Leptospira sp. 85282-16]